ncbi:MAG TPA: potassium channel family protein [Sphingomicrobium sp.]|nr:potassium channel family protein [Sphingomicrobium sp.]
MLLQKLARLPQARHHPRMQQPKRIKVRPARSRPPDEITHMTLRRKSALNEWQQIGLRALLMLVLLAFIVGVHWLERESLKDNLDGHVSFSDVIYFTMISATTTGYGDIVPVTDRARMFDAVIVTPIRIFFILILAGTAYTFVIKRTWHRFLMRRIQENLCNHIVVAGYGTSGTQTVDELIARGTDPKQIVVIDPNGGALTRAEDLGCAAMQGDATKDETLMAVRVDQARAIMISAGRDDTSILICLTARHLAPGVPISIAIRELDNELPARAAGGTSVINPVSFAGLLLAGSVEGKGITEYLRDLASCGGKVRLHEREIEPFEVGKSLSEVSIGIGMRIMRDGEPIGFWEQASHKLEPGDRIIEVIPEYLFPKVARA